MTGNKAPCFESINGYQLTQPWTTSGSAQWTYGEKDGQAWFLKRFLAPKYKNAGDGIPQKLVDRARERCETFKARQERLYQRVRAADDGNIIPVTDFFCWGSSFYAVSPKVPVSDFPGEEICRLPPEKRFLLMKILTHSMESLHAKGVVHGDLKPSNVILKRTAFGGYTLKLIDFDAGFLEEAPPTGEDIVFDPVYVSPETILAMSDSGVHLTGKADIFSLGLLFHLYDCGKLPGLPPGCPQAAQAVLGGAPLELGESLTPWLRPLIARMLSSDPEERPDGETVFQWLQAQKQPLPKQTPLFHKPSGL